jgi:hypothetical protein
VDDITRARKLRAIRECIAIAQRGAEIARRYEDLVVQVMDQLGLSREGAWEWIEQQQTEREEE